VCGLAGYVAFEEAPNCQDRLQNALNLLKNRGPNGSGIEIQKVGHVEIGLGHTRLSVLDLSSSANQPMVSFDKNFIIVFNGEIYNYLELRIELQEAGFSFVTDGDTEVLLNAWIAWGEGCLRKLNGMFSFSILNLREGTLTIVRDNFGIKPMYFAQIDNVFYFASTLPALNALTGGCLKPCLLTGLQYIANGSYGSEDNTFFENAKQLMPAHYLHVVLEKSNFSKQKKWWDPSAELQYEVSFSEATETIKDKFIQNIQMNMRSDVQYGAALSGGIDSSAIVAAMRYQEPNRDIETFSYIAGDEKLSEESWIDLVSIEKGTKSTKIFINDDNLITDLDDLIVAQGEPFGSSGVYAQYAIYKKVKESGVIVILDGQGADEIFCGYHGYPVPRILSMLNSFSFLEALEFFNNWGKYPGRDRYILLRELGSNLLGGRLKSLLKSIFSKSTRSPATINGYIHKNYQSVLRKNETPSLSLRNNVSRDRQLAQSLKASLLGDGLGKLLRHGDRNSMRWSVESRVPFLSAEMVEYVLGLPEDYLVSQNAVTKYAFREAMRGMVPDQVLDRHDKVGFEPPEKSWLLKNTTKINQILSQAHRVPLFDSGIAHKIAQDLDLSGVKFDSRLVWRVVNYVRWYELNSMGKI